MSCTIYLVSCCKEKQSGLHEARDLYVSPWFKLARAYVEKEIAKGRDRWWLILSAKHGVVRPHHKIHSYDESLVGMARGAYLDWLYKVQHLLGCYGDPSVHFVILAGKEYRQDLVHWLRHREATVEVPMEGLGIGEQLAWLKKAGAQ